MQTLQKTAFIFFIFFVIQNLNAQNATIKGTITSENKPIEYALIQIEGTEISTYSDDLGDYKISNLTKGKIKLIVNHLDFNTYEKEINLINEDTFTLNIDLTFLVNTTFLDDIVISGTMKAIQRLDSSIPVEVYSGNFFKKNPTPNIFDALQNVNGVKPQVNCNICNTGDIHINGLEGPYTMILIDGMPIVSSLGTVYGLSGIPNSLIERIEVVKGPASSLYGSEAIGGLINIITKKNTNAPILFTDVMTTSWAEVNADIGFKINVNKDISALTGINYFNFQNKIDKNKDNFTDVTLQNRISIFQKWNFNRKENRLFSIAGRFMYEDRWGGDMRWNKFYRGGNEIYGESIYTNRAELFGNYQIPTHEKIIFTYSFVNHNQDSRYGTKSYIANQKILFSQLSWDKKINAHDLLFGLALRYTYYDDNTLATSNKNHQNAPEKTWLPGIFIQDEILFNNKNKILLGLRYDYNKNHGNIYTPRIAYKWTINDFSNLRINAGAGFRVVNLFTEDHAALTGARDVIILNDLKPERSYNMNLNYTRKFYFDSGIFLGLETTAFYTYFFNRIVPDYETNTNQIIYDNLTGFAVSKGISINTDLNLPNGLHFNMGATLMENSINQNNRKTQQLLTEKFTGTWSISYKIDKWNLNIDYTGNVYSPMKLPLLSDLDPRKPYSPWFSIQNIQFIYDKFERFEVYLGVKNLLDWTPNKGNPFIIARTNDPFDKNLIFDKNGQPIATEENPYALTFDASYVYAANQGIRFFIGARFKLD